MTIIKLHTQMLPTTLTHEELLTLSRELANTVQATGAEVELQKNIKDQMKAKLSELQAKLTRLSIMVATGTAYRNVEVEVSLLDTGQVQETRLDTGEIIGTRSPYDSERQLMLASEEPTG